MIVRDQDRLFDLLADQATTGLSDEEKVELQELLAEVGLKDDWSFDQTATIIDMGMAQEEMVELPTHIRSRVIDDAMDSERSPVTISERQISSDRQLAGQRQRLAASVRQTPIAENTSSDRMTSFRAREAFAWLAAAACLCFAAFAWFNSSSPDIEQTAKSLPLVQVANQDDFDEFTEREDLLLVELEKGNDGSAGAASGTVYWDPRTKRGFIEIDGLAANDPSQEQYQLWVIDKVRGIEDRPNAGVFDVAASGKVVYEFRSELEIFDAQGFAVTVERPGGVSKSDLSRIALANLGS